MKPSMLSKLDQLAERIVEINALLAREDATANLDQYRKLTREHAELAGRASVALTPETLGGYDAVLISTDHAAVDYNLVAAHAKLIVVF